MGAKRPRHELIQLFREQRQALAASCQSYDDGNEWEAARLATSVYTLVHDGGSIVSLLTQLNLTSGLRFVSTGDEFRPSNLAAHTPLVFFRSQQTTNGVAAKTVPVLADPIGGDARQNQFPTWWTKEPIYKDSSIEMTRRRLVFALRHQDGGGHVGRLTDQAYIRMKTKEVAYALAPGQQEQPMYVMTATMRQIAWEVTETLKGLGEVS